MIAPLPNFALLAMAKPRVIHWIIIRRNVICHSWSYSPAALEPVHPLHHCISNFALFDNVRLAAGVSLGNSYKKLHTALELISNPHEVFFSTHFQTFFLHFEIWRNVWTWKSPKSLVQLVIFAQSSINVEWKKRNSIPFIFVTANLTSKIFFMFYFALLWNIHLTVHHSKIFTGCYLQCEFLITQLSDKSWHVCSKFPDSFW